MVLNEPNGIFILFERQAIIQDKKVSNSVFFCLLPDFIPRPVFFYLEAGIERPFHHIRNFHIGSKPNTSLT
ncbi:MAG: hypothetical protein IPK35_22010 [Saprospiraceae bacterium]|nr:hypothetical protein [Saprospiraceae bacterium]